MKPSIVLVVTDKESNAQLKRLGVSLLEVRVDLFKRLDAAYCIKELKKRRELKIPLLLTIRNQKKEGAVKEFSDAKKLALMTSLLPLVDWVDIELSSPILTKVLVLAKGLNKKVVVSTHNFINFPQKMEQYIHKSMSFEPNMVKIAVFLKNNDDLVRLIHDTYVHQQAPLVTLGIGPLGALSRLVLPAAGSRWVYTFLHKPTAAGQLNIKTLQEHLSLYYK